MESLVDFRRQDTDPGDGPRARFDRTRTEERVRVQNTGGYILDPRLLTFSAGGNIGLSQERVKSAGSEINREGTVDGFNAFAGIFPGAATSLGLFANRNNTFVSRELAGQTDTLSEIYGGNLSLRWFYIPSILSLRRDLREEESRTSDIVSRRRDRRDTFTYEGQRGWIDKETDIRYEYVDLEDFEFPDLSFRSQEGTWNYSQDFGTELNWHWDSRLRGFRRTGVADLKTWNLTESVRAEHTENLKTSYRYFFTQTDTPEAKTTTHTGGSTLEHRLYQNLITTLGLDGTFQSLPGGNRDILDGRLSFAYNKRLPKGGRVRAGLGGGLQYQDNRFRTTESTVTQESHTATSPFALPIALSNPFVVIASVVVTKVGTGPLPVGCLPVPGPPTPLVLGRDYTLRTSRDVTEIVPIPCSGTAPGINPGDTIAVDYVFTVSPSLTLIGTTWRASLGVDYGWIRPFFVHDETDQFLVSGRDGEFLDDRRSDILGMELRYDGEVVQASFLAEGEFFRSKRQSFNAFRMRQSLGFGLPPKVWVTLSANEEYFEFSRPRREDRTTASVRANLNYSLNASLFAEVSAQADYFKESLAPSERMVSTALRIRWFFRQMEVTPSLEFFDRKRGGSDTKEYQAVLRVVRRF